MLPSSLRSTEGNVERGPGAAAASRRSEVEPQSAIASVYRRVTAMIDHDALVRSRVHSLVRVAYGAPATEDAHASEYPLLLATQTVRALGLGVAVATAADNLPAVTANEADRYWHHALAVALTARELARRDRVRDRDRAFVAGFLHDVGLPLALLEAGEQPAVAARRLGHDLSRAPSPVHDPVHPEAGARLVEQWNMAPELARAIRLHHRPTSASVGDQADLLVHTLRVADWLAASQGVSVSGDPAASTGMPAARAALRLDDEALEQLCLGLDRRVSQVCAALSLSPVSPDLAARTLFRAQMRLSPPPADAGQEPAGPKQPESSHDLIARVAEALKGKETVGDRLCAFAAAVAERTDLECVSCGLLAIDQDVVVAGSGRGGSRVAPGIKTKPLVLAGIKSRRAQKPARRHLDRLFPTAKPGVIHLSQGGDLSTVGADVRAAAQRQP